MGRTDNYAHVMHSRGFRLTPQRQLILDAIHECGGHTTPDEIYEYVHAQAPAVNRATVYRTLELLLDLGLVTTAHVKRNQVIYELASSTPHHHLICQCCDRIEDIDHGLIAPFFAEIEQTYHFSIRTDHLVLFGLCDVCRTRDDSALLPQSGDT